MKLVLSLTLFFLVSVPSVPWSAASIFNEDFDGNVLNSGVWLSVGPSRHNYNNEKQCYVTSADAVSGGQFVITAQADTSCVGFDYTSGMIQWRSYNFTYGTVEFRAKMAGGSGTWPAVWLLGANCQAVNPVDTANAPCRWPQAGSNEIDLLEIMDGNLTTAWHSVVSPSQQWATCSPTITDASQNWHTYGFTWTPSSLTWTIDGAVTCTQTDSQFIPSTPMFLIMNTAVGGNRGGPINDATLPQTMSVDYVRVTPSDAVQGSRVNRFFVGTVHNYPNPFMAGRGSTKFVVETNEGGTIDLQIYDAGGQFVASIHRTISNAGRIDMSWDGRNGSGEIVSPGLYFVKIHGQGAHEETQFRRVVAVK